MRIYLRFVVLLVLMTLGGLVYAADPPPAATVRSTASVSVPLLLPDCRAIHNDTYYECMIRLDGVRFHIESGGLRLKGDVAGEPFLVGVIYPYGTPGEPSNYGVGLLLRHKHAPGTKVTLILEIATFGQKLTDKDIVTVQEVRLEAPQD